MVSALLVVSQLWTASVSADTVLEVALLDPAGKTVEQAVVVPGKDEIRTVLGAVNYSLVCTTEMVDSFVQLKGILHEEKGKRSKAVGTTSLSMLSPGDKVTRKLLVLAPRGYRDAAGNKPATVTFELSATWKEE